MQHYSFEPSKARFKAFPSQSNLLRNTSLPALSKVAAANNMNNPLLPPREPGTTAALFESLTLESRTACSSPTPRANPRSGTSFDIEDAKKVLKVADNDQAQPLPITPPDTLQGKPSYADQVKKSQTAEKPICVEAKSEDNVFQPGSVPTGKQHPRLIQYRNPQQVQHPTTLASTQQINQSPALDHSSDPVITPESKPPPRADRINDPITPENAQGVFPPEACVFVANLSVARSDEELELSCGEIFNKFGPCVVKVRRDKHKHPYALVQYQNIEDAGKAVKEGANLTIDGRLIRTEHGKARRTVILSKNNNLPVSEYEARSVLNSFGPIAQMRQTTNSDAKDHGVPIGMWVEFAYYLDYKDALKHFRDFSEPGYQLRDAPPIEPSGLTGPSLPISTVSFRNPRSATDQKSIFVGNLPADTSEHELADHFKKYGEIKACNVIRKPILGGAGFNIFGFIEFTSALEADRASQDEVHIRGQKIRVEPKEYSARRFTRVAPPGPPPSPSAHVQQTHGINWSPSSGGYQHHMMPFPSAWVPVSMLGSMMPNSYITPSYGASTPPSSANHHPYQPTARYGNSDELSQTWTSYGHNSGGNNGQSNGNGGNQKNIHGNWRAG